MVASSGGVATRGRWNLSLFLAQTGLASSGQVHHVRQREDAGLHMEVGPRIHRRNQGHTALPLNAKRREKLTLLHEGYAKNSEAKKTRDEDIEGWTFFLRKLQEQGQEP